MRQWLIRKLGGFSTTDDAIEEIKKLGDEEKHKILTLAVKRLFNTISAEDILRERGEQWFFMDRLLSRAEIDLLIAEATNFLNSKLWNVLRADIKYNANKTMFTKSTKELDMIAGKLWLFSLDAFTTRLKSMSNGSGRLNNK